MVDLRCHLDVMPMVPHRHNQQNTVTENLLTDNINQLPTNKKNIILTLPIHQEAVLLKQKFIKLFFLVVPAITYKKETAGITDNALEKLPSNKVSLIISEILHLIKLRYYSHSTVLTTTIYFQPSS